MIKLGETKQTPVKNKNGLPIRASFKNEKMTKSKEHLVFSFESLDFSNEYFNLDGTCINWTFTMFQKLKIYSEKTPSELLANPRGTIRFHNHEKGNAEFKPPYDLDRSDFYQLRFGTSKGGIHGVLVENIFYIIWIDPQHNMYPDEKYGGLKIITPPMTCCKERDSDLAKLNKELEATQRESKEWQALVEESYIGKDYE